MLSSRLMCQFDAIFYMLRAKSKRMGAIVFQLLNLLLPIGILLSVYMIRRYAQSNMNWATNFVAGFMSGYGLPGSSEPKAVRQQLLAVLSLCLDYALVWSFMLVALFSFPITISAFVNDRTEGLRDLLSSMGLSRYVYWASNGTFIVLTLLLNLGVLVLGGLALGLPVLLKTNFVFTGVLLVSTAVAYVGLAAVLSNLFVSTRLAVMCGYLICFVLICAVPGLMAYGFENEIYPPAQYMWLPPVSSFRAMHSMVLGCMTITATGEIDTNEPCLHASHFTAAGEALLSGRVVDIVVLDPREKLAAQSIVALAYLVAECLVVWILAMALDVLLRAMPHVPLDDSAGKRKHGRNCMVDARGVKKRYINGFEAVKGVSMEVFVGDSIGLLGPNGAGKTTMCQMMTGLLSPSEGEIKVWNKEGQVKQSECSLGICAQHTTLFPDLTVAEHLLTFARIKAMEPTLAAMHVDAMLAKVGLVDKADCFPYQLSGGMQRKLAICLAVVGEPGLVVLDEPTTGLDPMARESIWDIVRGSTAGCNVVTTHMLEEAEALSTNIYVMARGKVVAQGSPQELKDKYGSGYALTVECQPDQEDRVIAALGKILQKPGLTPRKKTKAGQFEFGVGSDTMAIGRIFQTLHKEAPGAGVLRWGMSQSTLQDAYMAIVGPELPSDAAHKKTE